MQHEDNGRFFTAHHTTPQHPYLVSHRPTTSPHEPAVGFENAPTISPEEAQRQFDPFIFVNEQDLQSSTNNDLRTAIRSHVRRGTHLKQKRLNEASRPNPKAVKRILKRPGFKSEDSAISRGSEALTLRRKHEFTPAVASKQQTWGSAASSSRAPVDGTWEDQNLGPAHSSITSGPFSFHPGIAVPADNTISYSMQTLPHFQVSRQQLDSSK